MNKTEEDKHLDGYKQQPSNIPDQKQGIPCNKQLENMIQPLEEKSGRKTKQNTVKKRKSY